MQYKNAPARTYMRRPLKAYIDDVSLVAIEEPPLSVATPLDEYYVGEQIPWSISAPSMQGQLRIVLSAGNRLVAEQSHAVSAGALLGTFETRGLDPGVYTLRAATASARRDIRRAAGHYKSRSVWLVAGAQVTILRFPIRE